MNYIQYCDSINYGDFLKEHGITDASMEVCVNLAMGRVNRFIDNLCVKMDRQIETTWWHRHQNLDISFHYIISVDPSTYNPMSAGNTIHIYKSIYNPNK